MMLKNIENPSKKLLDTLPMYRSARAWGNHSQRISGKINLEGHDMLIDFAIIELFDRQDSLAAHDFFIKGQWNR